MMIDTWLLAVFFLSLLTLGALIRVARIKSRFDRLVAALVTIPLAASAGLLLSIALGNLLVLNITIVLVLIMFAALVAAVHSGRGETA
jgi:multisubunit Na+/H+ antiporter MnhF subunit